MYHQIRITRQENKKFFAVTKQERKHSGLEMRLCGFNFSLPSIKLNQLLALLYRGIGGRYLENPDKAWPSNSGGIYTCTSPNKSDSQTCQTCNKPVYDDALECMWCEHLQHRSCIN